MNYTEEQVEKCFDQLPDEVQDNLFSPEIEHKVQKVGIAIGLLIDQQKKLNALVNFVLLGLLSEKEFSSRCQEAFSLEEKDAEEIGQIFSREIFAPIGEIKARALEKQVTTKAEDAVIFGEETIFEQLDISPKNATTPQNYQESLPDLAPDNLPVAEEVEPLIPPIPPKILSLSKLEPRRLNDSEAGEVATHPFEEKMKRVLTAGTQQMGELAIEAPSPQSNVSPSPSIYHADPYREPIE